MAKAKQASSPAAPKAPPPGPPGEQLFAVTRLNINGVELVPDDELPADQVETLDEAEIEELINAGVIRRGAQAG